MRNRKVRTKFFDDKRKEGIAAKFSTEDENNVYC